MKLPITKTLIVLLYMSYSNTMIHAMVPVGESAAKIAQTAAPALSIAIPQLLNNLSSGLTHHNQNRSINANYNPQAQNYTDKSATPDYVQKAFDYTGFDQNKQTSTRQAQPTVDMDQAFAYADLYDLDAGDDLFDTYNHKEQPSFNPQLSISQNLYGKKPTCPFTQQRRDYATFAPKSNNPYDILGVSRTATPEEIKAAHRKLVKEYHPDLNQENKKEATQALQKINNAYHQIKNDQIQILNDNVDNNNNLHNQAHYTWTKKRIPNINFSNFNFESMIVNDIDDKYWDKMINEKAMDEEHRIYYETRDLHGNYAKVGFKNDGSFNWASYGPQKDTIIDGIKDPIIDKINKDAIIDKINDVYNQLFNNNVDNNNLHNQAHYTLTKKRIPNINFSNFNFESMTVNDIDDKYWDKMINEKAMDEEHRIYYETRDLHGNYANVGFKNDGSFNWAAHGPQKNTIFDEINDAYHKIKNF